VQRSWADSHLPGELLICEVATPLLEEGSKLICHSSGHDPNPELGNVSHVRYFAWRLLNNRVCHWLTQLGNKLWVQLTVMKIFVMARGVRKGPFDLDALKQSIRQGEIGPLAMAHLEGQDKWVELRSMPELQAILSTPAYNATNPGANSSPACPPVIAGQPHLPQVNDTSGQYNMPMQALPPLPQQPTPPSITLPSSARSSSLWKTVQILMLCITVVAVVSIWKASNPNPKTAVSEEKPPEVNVRAIQAVITKDHQLGEIMRKAVKMITIQTDADLDQAAAFIRKYTSQGKDIDTHSCPRAFAEAYSRHLSAWEDQAMAISNHPHIPEGMEAFVEGLFRGLNGDITGGSVERMDRFRAWWATVKATDIIVADSWHEVEALAVRYGAK